MVWAGLITFAAGAAVTALSTIGPEGSGRATAGVIVMVLGALMFGGGLVHRALRRRRRTAGGRTASGSVIAGTAAALGGTAKGGMRPGMTGRPVADVREAVYRTGKGRIAAIVIAALYIVSPLDFVPEVLLPFGVVDDATALTWLIFAVRREYGRHREAAALRAQLAEQPYRLAPDQPVVPAPAPAPGSPGAPRQGAVKRSQGRSPR